METFKEIDIKYYDNSGNVQVRCTVPVTQDALVHYELMQSHYCKLSFKLSKPIYFLLGDFIDTPYGRFELIDLTKVKDNDTIGYSYEIQFDAYYRKLKNKILKYRPNTGSQEATFSLTSKISTHVEVIMKNLSYYAKLDKSYLYDPKFIGEGTDYTYVIDASVDASASKLITYSNASILDAIANIAQTFNCEWWFEGNILHFGTCENTNAIVDFKLDGNIVSMSSSQNQSAYANRVYAFGAARNLPSGYKKDADADITKDGVVEKRLMLPTSAECSDKNKQLLTENGFELKNGYIQVSGLREDQYVEGVTTNDDIYPRNLIKTSNVTSYEKDVEDESTPEEGDFIKRTFYRVGSLTIIGEDGEKTGDMAFRKSYILSGKSLHIVFQSGSLNGMDFECEFNPDGVEEILKDKDGNPILKDGKEQINPKSQVFEIVANEDYGRFLPDITLHPKDGDTFVLYNWDSSKLGNTLVSSASNELLTDAIKNLKKSMIDPTTYTCTAEANYSYNQGMGNLHGVGDRVNLYNKGYGDSYRSSRIIGYEFCLDIPYDGAKYYVGEKPSYSRLNAMESKIEELVYNGQSYLNNGGGPGGSSIYIIKSYDKTSPTEYNVYSARAVDKRYLSKLTDDIANGKITFIKGLIAKALVDLEMGAKFGNNAKITELGEAFFSAIKSLDYDNAAEQGFSVEKEKNGKYHAFFTNLTIWGKARFHELEIRKLSYSGGNIYLSGAGSKLIKVVPVKQSVSNGVTTWVETTDDDVERFGWKCYLLADNGTTATMNYWQEGDQARCQTMGEIVSGGTYQNASNKSYWRTIPNGGVSTQNEKIYGKKTETYLDEDGNEQTREVQVELYDGQAFAWIVIGKHCRDIDGYDDEFSVGYNDSNPAPLETRGIPAEGDTIVLDGNRHRNEQGEYDKTDRQNVIILETTGEYAPRIACYANITEYKHTFTKRVNGSDKEVSLSVFETSPKVGTKINSSRFEWISDDGSTINIINYRGDWVEENTTYHKNDQVNHNNAVWVCVANSGVDVTEEPSDGATYWKKVLSGGKGEKGDDGKTPQPTGSAETYYAITSSPSTEPNDSSWKPTPIDTSKYQGKFLWTDNRTEWKIGDKTEWISNKTCSYIGKDGANGTSVSIKGSLSDIGELPVSGNVNGDSYLIDGYLWIYTGTSVDDDNHHNGFENVGKIKGEDGISATQYYYHVAWMNTSDNSDNSFTTTNPSGSSYAYIGTLIDTTENDSDDYTKYDWAYVKGDRGEDGKNSVRLDLTNESSTVTCDKDGNIIGTIQGTVAILYDGAKEADINMVSYSISSYKGLSSIPTISEGGVISDLSVSGGKTSLEASINIKAVYKNQDYYATYTITKVLAGSDGTPATTYWIEPSATAIKVDSYGNANPSTITCKQYKQVGAESPVAGDKKIYYRHNAMDSTLWNEYTEAINPATNVDAYEFVLADKTPSNSSAIIYDRESIPVIKDGQNGNDGLSGNGIVPAYIRSKDNPTPPTSTDKNNLDNGWSLAIPSVADVKNVSYSDSSWTDYSDDSYTWKKSPTTAANSTSWCLVTFTTTQANQTVMFVIKSFSEKKYDYIFLSEIDASDVPSKPGFAGASRAVSGNGLELSITDVVATAGTHTVYICYGKDASGDYNGDYGLFRIESMAGIPLWQSNGKEVFSREDNGTIKSKIESWSEPFKVTGEDGADGKDGTDGEQGESALEIIVTPETLVFDTNDYGLVPPETSKQASISCYRNGVKVTNVSYRKSAEENCLASVSESNGSATVTISKITSQEVADTSGNSSTVSNMSGYATIQVCDKDTNLDHRVQVKFMVNVAQFTGQMVNTNKRFSKTLTEVGNKVDSFDLNEFKSEITQTAREISLSVSEKSIGRRNLLVGSDFKRKINNFTIRTEARIEMNSGYNGTNCIKVIDDTDGTSHYVGVYWDGSQGGRSVKIEKGKKYTISCYYKTNDSNAKFSLEAIYTNKETNAERLGRPKILSKNMFDPKYNQWELFTTVIDTTDAESDYVAFNFWEYCKVDAGIINAYICRPMVEEGDTYNGWTLSQDDYDIIGANLIDNSRTLDTGGNVIEAKGQKALVGDAYELTYKGSDDYNQFYRIKGDAFKLNTDYTLSFEVRGDAKYIEVNAFYPANNTKYTCYVEQQNDVMYEKEGDGTTVGYVTLGQFKELSKQQRVWCHFRFKDRLPEQIYFQFKSNTEQTGVTSWSVTITRPKIEVGAVVTEYTERKSDLIDKASLKAAGIEITSDQVTLYGNKVQVKNPKENPSEGYDEAAMFQNGKLNAQFINAGEVVAEGIKTQKLEAQNLNVIGNSRLGIFEIHKAAEDERDEYTVNGDSIKYSGSYMFPDGKTEASGAGSFLTYKPMFIRQGAPDGYEYMRLGHQFTEWDDGNISGGSKNYFFVGAAARYVCSGDVFSCTRNVLPVTLKYNSDIKPAAYVYSVLAKDSAAFAICTNAVGTAGERLAIQTNGAIRCVEALNIETIYRSQQISSGIGAARCVNTAEITIRLPINPVVGQKFYVLQEDTGKVNITGDSNHQIILFNKGIVTTCNSNTKGQISVFIWSGNYWFGSFLTGTL